MSPPARPPRLAPLVLSVIAVVGFLAGVVLLARWRILLVVLAVGAAWVLDRIRRMAT